MWSGRTGRTKTRTSNERRAFRGRGADAGGAVEGNADAGNGAVVVDFEKLAVELFKFLQIDAHVAAFLKMND
jgi:hypothetical protein